MSTSAPHLAAQEELQAAAPAGAVCQCGLVGTAPAVVVAVVVAAVVVVAVVARVVAAALVAA